MSTNFLDVELPQGVVSADDWTGIGNEFTGVQLRVVHTRNGSRLQIVSPKQETSILLDPLALEAITAQEPDFFTRLIAARTGAE